MLVGGKCIHMEHGPLSLNYLSISDPSKPAGMVPNCNKACSIPCVLAGLIVLYANSCLGMLPYALRTLLGRYGLWTLPSLLMYISHACMYTYLCLCPSITGCLHIVSSSSKSDPFYLHQGQRHKSQAPVKQQGPIHNYQVQASDGRSDGNNGPQPRVLA
jgi:hypothetical protein